MRVKIKYIECENEINSKQQQQKQLQLQKKMYANKYINVILNQTVEHMEWHNKTYFMHIAHVLIDKSINEQFYCIYYYVCACV